MRLQRVESAKLVEFPETVEGFFGKVRWCEPFFSVYTSEPLHCPARVVIPAMEGVLSGVPAPTRKGLV